MFNEACRCWKYEKATCFGGYQLGRIRREELEAGQAQLDEVRCLSFKEYDV